MTITNRKTEQEGLLITKSDFESGVGRPFYPHKDGKYYYDGKWIPKYILDEASEMLIDIDY
jgi:hypothetical protein